MITAANSTYEASSSSKRRRADPPRARAGRGAASGRGRRTAARRRPPRRVKARSAVRKGRGTTGPHSSTCDGLCPVRLSSWSPLTTSGVHGAPPVRRQRPWDGLRLLTRARSLVDASAGIPRTSEPTSPATMVESRAATRPAISTGGGRSAGWGVTLLRNRSASARKANGTGSRRRNMGVLLLWNSHADRCLSVQTSELPKRCPISADFAEKSRGSARARLAAAARRVGAARVTRLEGPPAVTDTPAETSSPSFRSDVTVELVKHSAADSDVLFAARVSTAGRAVPGRARRKDPERSKGLINYLMRDRHGSPFEHNSMTFFISAPIFVFREFMRHRVGCPTTRSPAATASCSPVFYVPGRRAQARAGGPPGQVRLRRRHRGAARARRPSAMEDVVPPGVRGLPGDARGRASPARSPAASCPSACSRRCTPPERPLADALPRRCAPSTSWPTVPSFPQREIEMVGEKMEAALGQAHAAHPRGLQRERPGRAVAARRTRHRDDVRIARRSVRIAAFREVHLG